jgi:hypothetical protein
VEPGALGELGAALPGAAAGAELVPCGAAGREVGAADPGTGAESGAGSVAGAPLVASAVVAAVVAVVADDGRSSDVDVERVAR